MPKGLSRRIVVIGTCFQICSWITLGLLYLWQAFPGQKYVCMNHPGGLHMNWKCIPTSACLMYSACAVQLCTDSQMGPVHAAFTLSAAQSINYWGNEANDTCTQCRISGCFWTSYILRFIMEVKRGHAWDNPDIWECYFLRMIYPKGDYLEVVKYLLCISGLRQGIVWAKPMLFSPNERKRLIHDSWTKLRMKSYQSKNAPFKQCNIAPRCINLWSKIKPHDPHS